MFAFCACRRMLSAAFMRPAAVAVLALCAACSQHPQDTPPLAVASAETSLGSTTPASESASSEAAPSASTAVAGPPAARLYVRARTLAIHGEPSPRGKPIGTLVAGDVVPLRDEEPRATS